RGCTAGGDAGAVPAHRHVAVRAVGDLRAGGTDLGGALVAALLVADHHADANGALVCAVVQRGGLAARVRTRLRGCGLDRGARVPRRHADVRQEAVAGGSRAVGQIRLRAAETEAVVEVRGRGSKVGGSQTFNL